MEQKVKRLLDCTAQDFQTMNSQELLQSIKAAEGRTIMSEVQATVNPVPFNVTNAEIARAFSADLVLLNKLDVQQPVIGALPESKQPIQLLKKLVGCPIGVNLEPVDSDAQMLYEYKMIPKGRQANKENYQKCQEDGYDFILLTGNPSSGVTSKKISDAISEMRKYYKGIIMVGKMHTAGVEEDLFDQNILKSFIDNGADIILLPAPGTVPGVTVDKLAQASQYIHARNCLVISAIGTSQEASEKETIQQIALWNKMVGVDIHHIGATGYAGMAPYENIYTLSMAVRGLRHTVHRLAASNDR